MKFILGEKKEMTQKFAEDGTVIPVTKVLAGPCTVTQIKKEETDGYTAVQVSFGKKKKVSKPVAGHLGKLGNFRYLREFRVSKEEAEKLKVGDIITVSTFQSGDKVNVSGTSKGKGFQGVVKRWGFAGSPASHGHKDQLRMPGSIGAGGPQRVFKGTKMGGQLGSSSVTVSNLAIVEIDSVTNTLFIKGALPGSRNSLVAISGQGQLVTEAPKQQPVQKATPETMSLTKEQSVSKQDNIEKAPAAMTMDTPARAGAKDTPA